MQRENKKTRECTRLTRVKRDELTRVDRVQIWFFYAKNRFSEFERKILFFRHVPVPVEATAVLGAVAGFVVLLLALLLYLSRKWCFTSPSSTALFGGVCVPLCESTNSSTSQISKNIGNIDLSFVLYRPSHHVPRSPPSKSLLRLAYHRILLARTLILLCVFNAADNTAPHIC